MKKLRVVVCSDIKGLTSTVQAAWTKGNSHGNLSRWDVSFVEKQAEELEGSDEWRQARVVLADPGRVCHMLDDAHALQWMQSTWAGINSIMNSSRKRDYTLTRLGGCFGPIMSEYVMGNILLLERRFLLAHHHQKDALWQPDDFRPDSSGNGPRQLSSLSIGLLGYGSIGQHIAMVAKAFGMKTLTVKRPSTPQSPRLDEACDSLEEMLSKADYIVSSLPSTPHTRGLLDNGRLRACLSREPTARRAPVLINVGRGDVISESSILHALREGWISHAVLDVFSSEPLPKSSALWPHPRVSITPHVSAISFPLDVASLFVKNLQHFLSQGANETKGNLENLEYAVNFAKGY